MDKKIADRLISELGRHSGIVTPDKDLFLKILVYADVPESSRFYEVLPKEQQIVTEFDRCHYLALRRILRNRNAEQYLPKNRSTKDYLLALLKKTGAACESVFGAYSSNAMCRNLRANDTLVEMMASCEEPFSLLGKLTTYDFSNPDRTLIITQPVLVIPGAKDLNAIYDWERANTVYEKEILIMGIPIQIRARPQE